MLLILTVLDPRLAVIVDNALFARCSAPHHLLTPLSPSPASPASSSGDSSMLRSSYAVARFLVGEPVLYSPDLRFDFHCLLRLFFTWFRASSLFPTGFIVYTAFLLYSSTPPPSSTASPAHMHDIEYPPHHPAMVLEATAMHDMTIIPPPSFPLRYIYCRWLASVGTDAVKRYTRYLVCIWGWRWLATTL